MFNSLLRTNLVHISCFSVVDKSYAVISIRYTICCDPFGVSRSTLCSNTYSITQGTYKREVIIGTYNGYDNNEKAKVWIMMIL